MKYLIIFIVLGFFFPNNPFGKDIGRKVNKVVAFQTKRISKIIEKEGACSSLQGHLVNTCRGLKKGFSSDDHNRVMNNPPITNEYLIHLKTYVENQENFYPTLTESPSPTVSSPFQLQPFCLLQWPCCLHQMLGLICLFHD